MQTKLLSGIIGAFGIIGAGSYATVSLLSPKNIKDYLKHKNLNPINSNTNSSIIQSLIDKYNSDDNTTKFSNLEKIQLENQQLIKECEKILSKNIPIDTENINLKIAEYWCSENSEKIKKT